MKHEEVKQILRQDPEYVAAEKRLRPILDIANDVLRLRIKKGWTQQELAAHAGTRQAKISQLENGQGNTTLKLLQEVAEALDEELHVHIGEEMPAQPVPQQPVIKVVREIKVVVVGQQYHRWPAGQTKALRSSQWTEPNATLKACNAPDIFAAA